MIVEAGVLCFDNMHISNLCPAPTAENTKVADRRPEKSNIFSKSQQNGDRCTI